MYPVTVMILRQSVKWMMELTFENPFHWYQPRMAVDPEFYLCNLSFSFTFWFYKWEFLGFHRHFGISIDSYPIGLQKISPHRWTMDPKKIRWSLSDLVFISLLLAFFVKIKRDFLFPFSHISIITIRLKTIFLLNIFHFPFVESVDVVTQILRGMFFT